MVTLADKIIKGVKEMEKQKQFAKDIKGETRQLMQWAKDIEMYSKMEDSEYKFAQLNNAISAIYSLYCRLNRVTGNYKPDNK
jgi:hypothetical protein